MNMFKLTDPEGYLRNSDGVIVFVSKSKNKKNISILIPIYKLIFILDED